MNTSPELWAATTGAPATSGTVQPSILALKNSDTYSTLYFGADTTSPYAVWLQASQRNNLATNTVLELNPNGGNVLIGKDSDDGVHTLQVNGTGIFTSTLTASNLSGNNTGDNPPAPSAAILTYQFFGGF
jgi:hypothetical protein